MMIDEMAQAINTPIETPLTKQQLIKEWLANTQPAYKDELQWPLGELGVSFSTFKKYPWLKSGKNKYGVYFYTELSKDPYDRPISRYESSGYGWNFKIPARLESILYKALKKTLSKKQVHLWWNSSYARHWGDAYEASFKYPTTESFLQEIKKKDEWGLSGLRSIYRDVKRMEEKGDLETTEDYHKGNVKGMIVKCLKDLLDKYPVNPKVNHWIMEKYGREVISILFTDPRSWNY